uniref:Uncharacterized protein n=1 Tax=Rhizophora mucronata TaxID=61149 RepID=A0A2P2NKG1_RHIMU
MFIFKLSTLNNYCLTRKPSTLLYFESINQESRAYILVFFR